MNLKKISKLFLTFIIFCGFNCMIRCFNIYVLELACNKFYVGKTLGSVESNFLIHQIGEGNEWTRKYIPKSIIEKIKQTNNIDENHVTKIYMSKYGINNVRGGSFSNVILNDFEKKYLLAEIEQLNCIKK